MLILTRRIGETIMIGDNVACIVLGVRGSQVRLGIDAPKEVAVHREEIYQRIQQEKMHPAEAGEDPIAAIEAAYDEVLLAPPRHQPIITYRSSSGVSERFYDQDDPE